MSSRASTSSENKSLQSRQTEDKVSAGAAAPAQLDSRMELADLRASDTASQDLDKIRVRFVHHVGEKVPGNHSTLPADEANALITSGVAVLDPKD